VRKESVAAAKKEQETFEPFPEATSPILNFAHGASRWFAWRRRDGVRTSAMNEVMKGEE
jgi:hypothetical protein